MKRVLAIGAVLVAAIALIVIVSRASGDGGGYKVRAIFDNASFVIGGEDVKIAGVKVGKIGALDVTPNNKAAVVLDITDDAYQDFRTDAFCTIRPQGLIGEKFVECTPTKPRAPGATPPPLLPKIRSGPGKGQHLLPATNTTKAVDLDLIANITQLPERQRLTIIINELGTALAGNGDELNAALKKSNPALRELDEVLAVLAADNRKLADLAKNGDAVLAPLARRKDEVAGFIRTAGNTAEATAERSADLALDIQKLPAFLRELGPTMQSLGDLSEQFTPVIEDLGRSASSINELTTGTPAFAKAGVPALQTLGDTADVGGPALAASLPLVKDLGRLGKSAKPLSADLSKLLTSFQFSGGPERLLDFIFYGVGSTNGYDEFGHYLRARLVLTVCQSYVVKNDPACTANFSKDNGAVTTPPLPPSSSSGSGSSSSPSARSSWQQVTAPATPSSAAAAKPAEAQPAVKPIALPSALLPGDGAARPRRAPAASRAPARAADPEAVKSLLDYLLGS